MNDSTARAENRRSTLFDRKSCCEETYFREMIALERKRSERSGHPLLVMTLNLIRVGDIDTRRETARDAIRALAALTRETDIKGWYRQDEVLGVIFTEINNSAPGTIESKVVQGLQRGVAPEALELSRILFHRFPEGRSGSGRGGPSEFTFFPELKEKEKSRRAELAAKRFIDIIGSIFGILLFSPCFLLIPLWIKMTSAGPVLFKQTRVGQHEKLFIFFKFRSMYVNNDDSVHKAYVRDLIAKNKPAASGGSGEQKVFKIVGDKRVTPIGRLLRKTSLDELPQFFNVLRGDMSLTGPRPPIPYELEQYDPWHRCRVMEIKPGITGLWQVVGRSSTNFDEMVRLDLQYARHWTIWLDLKILLKTPWAMIAGKGAY
ncbi:MAG: sugar transferase [Nitrospiraceae bacterium]|nr:sugar transferase [Nitrospiraceae bacterium]